MRLLLCAVSKCSRQGGKQPSWCATVCAEHAGRELNSCLGWQTPCQENQHFQSSPCCGFFSCYRWAGRVLASARMGDTAWTFSFLSQTTAFRRKIPFESKHICHALFSINQKEESSTQLRKKIWFLFSLNCLTFHGEMPPLKAQYLEGWVLHCQTTSNPELELRTRIGAQTSACPLGPADKKGPATFRELRETPRLKHCHIPNPTDSQISS